MRGPAGRGRDSGRLRAPAPTSITKAASRTGPRSTSCRCGPTPWPTDMKVQSNVGAMLVAASAHSADIAVLASNAVKEAYLDLAPEFEKGGHVLKTTWSGTNDIVKRVNASEPFDVVIVASDSLE